MSEIEIAKVAAATGPPAAEPPSETAPIPQNSTISN